VAARPIISDELARFLASGLSVTVGTRDDELQPDVAVAWAARVLDDRSHVLIYLAREAAKAMARNLKRHPEIAVAFDLPTTQRACQVKGVFVSTRPAKAQERAEVERQAHAFNNDLAGIGITNSMVAGWTLWPCAVIEFRVTELFEQTPGPGAGEPLT
jgi:predicted pyridoxine 5'-phosphate oxidase superfamily flavin-nucleotide-binding protein